MSSSSTAAEGVAGGTAGGTATAGGAEIAIVAPGAGAAIGGAEAVGTITASDSLATVEAIQAATKATEFSSTAAAEAAEVAAINAIRTELGVGQSRNIAYATAQIGEETEQFIGVSGQAARPGTVEVPENPIFQTFATGQNSRMFDSEVKILEEIASRYANNPDIQGTVRLVSERPPCVSCSSVIDQFKAMFPNIRVTVSHIGK